MTKTVTADICRIRAAWQGRVSGCILGKPLEILSFQEGREGLIDYLEQAEAMPLRHYVPLLEGTVVERTGKHCCAGHIERAEPDDDINYTILALLLLEQHGADLAARDASLSHHGDGIHGAIFIAALGASIPITSDIGTAVKAALQHIPAASAAADAVQFATGLCDADDAVAQLHREFAGLPPVHTLNNLALVTWAVTTFERDFSSAIGNVVMAGWDTDCNGATVGGLLGLAGTSIPETWTSPWRGRIATSLAGIGEITVDKVTARTLAVANDLIEEAAT